MCDMSANVDLLKILSIFKILSTDNSYFDCKIREALLIKSEKPTLNQQLFQNGSTFILCVFK